MQDQQSSHSGQSGHSGSNRDPLKHPAISKALKRLEHLNPDQFEIYFKRTSSVQIDAKNQELDALTREEDVGISIRLIKDRRMGFSFTTSLDPERIVQAADMALEVATVMPQDDNTALFSFNSAVYPSVDHFDRQGLAVPIAKKIEMARNLEAQCRSVDSRITGVRAASLSETSTEIHLIDSSGEHIQHTTTQFTANVTCKAEQDGDSQIGSDFAFSNYLDTLDIAGVAQRAAQYGVELLGAGAAPTMNCPAILRNSVVGSLLDFLSASFSAEEIEKGRSMLAGKMGQYVFSEKVTLIDDGLLPGGYSTCPFDGEGIPTGKTILVDKGHVSGALYNYYYAKQKGVDPTGSSVRGIKSPPSIRFTNLYLKPGRKSFTALADGISKGVLITDLMGVHTANPVTGDFSLGASGILIENGKLTRPVRGFAIAGNVLELFRRMTEVGDDLRFFGGIGAPSVRLSEIAVGGA